MRFLQVTVAALCGFASVSSALSHGARDLRNLAQLNAATDAAERAQEEIDAGHGLGFGNGTSSYGYLTRYIDMPINHFPNDSIYNPNINGTFANRYWFTDRYYKPGGPVFLLLVGEASGTLRLPILHTGIAHEFIKAHNGLGVVMEHRFYGKSFPTSNLSNENLRYLTTQQALADCAYLAQNVQFAGLEQYNLTSPSVPWIVYGGSYSGAMSAFLRVQYPDIFWGAVSSSGVVEVIVDYWQYWAPIAQYGPSTCMAVQKFVTNLVDTIYDMGNSTLNSQLQNVFLLPNVTHFNDFANTLASGVGNWQEIVWNPAISSPLFSWFCGNASSTSIQYSSTESLRSDAEDVLDAAGISANTSSVNQMLNFIGWMNETYIAGCYGEQDICFDEHNTTNYEDRDTSNFNLISWEYQVCSQWGFFQTGSGWPNGSQGLISRTIDLEYMSIPCRKAFDIHTDPDVELSNQYGGYNIAYDRLAIINGEWDPWRPATPAAFPYGASHRQSTTDQPFHVIPRAIHHWDEYGVKEALVTRSFPPRTIQKTHTLEAEFFTAWLEEWNSTSSSNSTWSR